MRLQEMQQNGPTIVPAGPPAKVAMILGHIAVATFLAYAGENMPADQQALFAKQAGHIRNS